VSPADLSEDLLTAGSATLSECGALPMHPRIKPVWPGARLAAPAWTARCEPGDNLAIHVAVAEAAEGRAIVADCSAEPERGYWGEVLTTAAEVADVAGLVIDGCVRDTTALAAHGFPVFSAGVALRGASKEVGGTVGVAVVVGGVEVRPADWVVGDDDGVVVVRAGEVDEVLRAATRRLDREQVVFAALKAGDTTLDLLGLDGTRVRRA
jgi:4-hydroxy-4-methyl-2-oxoglutarate aldolase